MSLYIDFVVRKFLYLGFFNIIIDTREKQSSAPVMHPCWLVWNIDLSWPHSSWVTGGPASTPSLGPLLACCHNIRFDTSASWSSDWFWCGQCWLGGSGRVDCLPGQHALISRERSSVRGEAGRQQALASRTTSISPVFGKNKNRKILVQDQKVVIRLSPF